MTRAASSVVTMMNGHALVRLSGAFERPNRFDTSGHAAANTGRHAPATIDPRLMYRLAPTTINHTTNTATPGTVSHGKIASIAPSEVATPLPPLNLSHD